MKNTCKRIYGWVVNLLKSLVSLASVLFFSDFKSAAIISKFSKSKPKTRDCLVLGNGPSLRSCLDSSMNKIREYDTVAVNLFCENSEFSLVKPNYYVLTDPGFFDSNPKEERIKKIQDSFIEGISLVNWEMILFLPSLNRKSRQVKRITNPNIKILFYNYTPVEGFERFQNRLFKLNLGMPCAMSVVCASIFLMINLHYKNIYMIGMDHNMIKNLFVNDNNELMLLDEHFNDKKEIKIQYSIYVYTQAYATCMKTHERLAIYAPKMGVCLWNATEGSYVDAYMRDYIFKNR